jgi:hypothetical protein
MREAEAESILKEEYKLQYKTKKGHSSICAKSNDNFTINTVLHLKEFCA